MEKKVGVLMEIGSIYEIDPEWEKPQEPLKTAPEAACSLCLDEVMKYGKKHGKYTASGREAIALVLKSLEKDHPDLPRKCLMPAYMCDSVFFPFVRAGWELIFYHIGKDLAPDAEALTGQIKENRPGLLFVHPYYGVDTWKPIRSFFAEWKTYGVMILEDVTQSYYLESGGQGADYVAGSLRKWYPVPDGGFVVSEENLAEPEETGQEEAARARIKVLMEKWKYLHAGDSMDGEEKKACKEQYLQASRSLEEDLDDWNGIRPISTISRRILGRVSEEACRKKRQENCNILCSKLSAEGMKGFRLLLPEMKEAVPLYLPVFAWQRKHLQSYLRERDVFAPVLWPIGRENRDVLTEEELQIYEHMLALPIDQRYGAKEMDHLARILGSYQYPSSWQKQKLFMDPGTDF